MTAAGATKVLAAISGGSETGVVLNTANGIARLIGMEVEAVHVSDGAQTTTDLGAGTRAVGVRLHERQGPVAEQILDTLELPQVWGVVIGARMFMAGPRPAGSTALQVLRGTSKPLVFVPPELSLSSPFAPRRLLVPLDGSAEASKAFLEVEKRFQFDGDPEVVVLYTLDGLTPRMLDRPGYDLPIWGSEFVLRYCPGENRSFEWRTGNPASAVIEVAEGAASDLIVLSFGGNLEVGHGAVIREVLARSSVPVLILPVSRSASAGDAETNSRDSRQTETPSRRTGAQRLSRSTLP